MLYFCGMKITKSQLKILNLELIELKRDYEISKAKVAKAINVHPSQLSQYLNHGNIPEEKLSELQIIIKNKSV